MPKERSTLVQQKQPMFSLEHNQTKKITEPERTEDIEFAICIVFYKGFDGMPPAHSQYSMTLKKKY